MQVVVAVNLAQPGVLRIPRVVHGHRPLGNGIERVGRQVGGSLFQRRVPKGQRVKVGGNAFAQFIGRLTATALALGSQAKALQGVGVQRQLHRVALLAPALLFGKVQVSLVPVAHVVHALGQVVLEHAVVGRVGLPLLGVGLAAQVLVAVFTAPAHQKANAGLRLEVHHKIRVAGELGCTFGRGEGWEFEAGRQLDQHLLERPALPQRRHHRHTHRIHRTIKLRDRPVQHAHHIMPLQVSGVRQHQVGKGHGLTLEGVTHHQEGDHMLASLILAVEHLTHRHGVHRAVPGHVGHEDQQGVDAVGVTLGGVGDHVVHQAVGRQRVLPRKRVVDADRRAVRVDGQLVRVRRETQRRRIERGVGFDHLGRVESPVVGHDVARVRRLMPKAARRVDGAQHAHQHRQGPHRLKAVGVRCQPAHGMKGQRPRLGAGVDLAPGIGPGDRQLKGLLQGRVAHLKRQRPDTLGVNAGDGRRPLRRAACHPLAQQLERGRHPGTVGQRVVPLQGRVATVGNALGVGVLGAAAGQVPHQFVVRVAAVARRAPGRVWVKGKQALARAIVQHHQLRRVGETLEESVVDQVLRDQLVQQRHEQRAVGAGLDRNPLIGNGRVAGAHRVDGDEPAARALELGERDLHGVAVVVFGSADHHKQLGAVQVGAAKLPEAAAHGVNHAGGHVDRAKAAVCRVIGGAELARKQAGQGLHLVAPGEHGKLFRVSGANLGQPLGQQRHGLLPGDRVKLAGTALAARAAQQGLRQPRRRHLLHDARGALGTNHTLVQRVRWVAVDVAHLGPVLAFSQVHPDAAAAGAHVAGGALDLGLVGWCGRGQRVVQRLGRKKFEHRVSLWFSVIQLGLAVSTAKATEAIRDCSESAREVSTMGTVAPSTSPAQSPPPM